MKTKTKQIDIMQVLKDTCRIMYVDEEVAKAAPQSDSIDLKFFKLGRYMSDDELEKEYEKHGLRPATILELCLYDKEHRDVLDEKQWVFSHWKDKDDKWCFVSVRQWLGGRDVCVFRYGVDWGDDWWGCGVRKSKLDTGASKLLEPSNLDLHSRVKKLESEMEKIRKFLILD